MGAHVFVLALTQLLVYAVDQPYKTERPLAGVPPSEEEPPDYDYTLNPPVRTISDVGPYLVMPDEVWVNGGRDSDQHYGENHQTAKWDVEHSRPAPEPEYQPGALSNIYEDIEPLEGLPNAQEDAISDIPDGGTGVAGAIGAGGGGSGSFGSPSEESLLPEDSGRRTLAFAASSEVLQAALKWLVATQAQLMR